MNAAATSPAATSPAAMSPAATSAIAVSAAATSAIAVSAAATSAVATSAAATSAVTVIRNVLLFDGESVHCNATVTFDAGSGLITSVSTAGTQTDGAGAGAIGLAGATVINGQGHTLIPGLIDAHIHCHDMHSPPDNDPLDVLRFPLRAGVTTVCDMHSDTNSVHALQQAVKADLEQARTNSNSNSHNGGTINLSDLKSSHLAATIKDGWPKPIILGQSPTEQIKARVAQWPDLTTANASHFIEQHKAAGADYIKLMQENGCSFALPPGSVPCASLELQTAVVQAAHAAGFQCYGHATNLASTELLLNSGVDGLTHTFFDQAPTPAIIHLYRAKGAFVIPTLVVLASLTSSEGALRRKFAHQAAISQESNKQAVIDNWTHYMAVQEIAMAAPSANMQHAYDSVMQLNKAGIDIVAGSDSAVGLKGTMVGPSLWMELYLYVHRCGFSPVQALRSATGLCARRFGFDDRGFIRPGKRADIVLVAGDLSLDLAGLWQAGGKGIVQVWKSGLASSSHTLTQQEIVA